MWFIFIKYWFKNCDKNTVLDATKAAIIQAVMENQNLILLDEPTRGLDIDSMNQFDNLVKKLKQEGKQ